MSVVEDDPALKIHLTAEEKEAVNKLRERLGSSADGFDDAYLVRFCRARRLDIDLTHTMFVKHLQWRKDYDVENIVKKSYPYKDMWDKILINMKHGFDRHGRPISIEKIGRMHVPAFLKHGTNERIIETHIWFMNHTIERMREKSKELGRPVTTNVSIMDMDGLGVQHRKLTHLFGLVAQMDQDNYPEMLGALYIINAPWLFTAIWAVCQTFLDKVTKAKMHVLGRDLSQMIEDLGAENVPVEYGGTCKQCGGKCIPDDPPVPDDGMEVKEDAEELELKECTVKNGGKHEIKLEVAAGKSVRWYFKTNKDISFSAEFTPTGGKPAVIVPSARVNSHTYPIQGDYQAKEAGTCALIWDNSYSYFASKTLRYYIENETQ